MKWPRDRACPDAGEGIYARLKALPQAIEHERVVALLPWWTRLRVWLGSSWRSSKRRRGTSIP